MPELPEVETIRRELEPHIVGRRINGVTLVWEGIVKRPSPEEFRSGVTGRKIVSLDRSGKYLVARLDNGMRLVMHLKMTGALLMKPDAVDNKYVRAILHFDGLDVYFRDPRKFGAMWLVGDERTVTGRMGPDPLEPGFTARVLQEMLRDRKTPIKALICEQSFIAGIGNMYADEALFLAGIHPSRTAGSLSSGEVTKLHHAIRKVLRAGLERMGASVLNYYRPSGEKGTAHHDFNVAHRRGEACFRCGTPLVRLAIRGRGSYFCPKCQH